MSAVFKQEAHQLVDQLSETATWDDLIEQAQFRKAIEEGIAAADRGEFASEEEVRRAFAKWGVDAFSPLQRHRRHSTPSCGR